MISHLGVELTQEIRQPVTDPTMGVKVDGPSRTRASTHKLVTVGDSLTQGFQHFAIFNTANSWPMMVAAQLRIADSFRYPKYLGPGGHPLNLEWTLRKLHRLVVEDPITVGAYMEEVEHHYEKGAGSVFPPDTALMNENLAIWGWDLRDTLMRTAAIERAEIGPPQLKLPPMVNFSGQRAAVTVLNSARTPTGQALTPLEGAKQLGDDPGGIETLCVWLGANNVLGSVLSLKINLSGPGYDDLKKKSAYNVWTVNDFVSELKLVAGKVRSINAQHVLWATVPHVTIPPIAHGLGGTIPQCNRYFKYYARPWETDDTFDPRENKHLVGIDAWAIDTIIDGYNLAIESMVREAREDGQDWMLVDMCAVLDRLAYRRNVELKAAPDGITPYPLPNALTTLDTRFFTASNDGAIETGGLIGLDGVHPTTCGYGIVAQEFINVMASAGVSFPNGERLDFPEIRTNDTLVSNPPARIQEILSLIAKLDETADLIKRLLAHI